MKSLRCTLPGCSCECFNPCKTQIRSCQSCQHGWVAHALDKLASRALFPSLHFTGIQTSDVFDIASLLLYGAHAVPIRCKIMLDHLFRALNPVDIKQILEGLGWDEKDYMTGYMSHDDDGKLRRLWQKTTDEEELIILNQFLRFSETKSMAEQMIFEIQQQNNNKNSIPKTHKSNLQDFITNLRASKRQSSDVLTSQSVSCTSSDQTMDYGEHVLSPAQASKVTQSSTEYSTKQSSLFPHRIGFPSLVHSKEHNKYSDKIPFPHKKMRLNHTTPNKDSQRPHYWDIERHRRTKDESVPGQVIFRPGMFTPALSSSIKNTPMVCLPSKVNMPLTASDNFHGPIRTDELLPISSVSQGYNLLSLSPITTAKQIPPPSLSLPYTKETLPCTRLSFPDENVNKGDSSFSEESSNNEENFSNDLTMSSPNYQELDASMENSWHMSNCSKRVLCNICQKWFYDKGTWKIHFGAVHLKVKYHCTVEGCNMTFSSIRSRNRHSSNPNPKIHKSEPVHRKAYTRKQQDTGKVPMIELPRNTIKQAGSDSDESCNDEEQTHFKKDTCVYSVNYNNDLDDVSKDEPTQQDIQMPSKQFCNLAPPPVSKVLTLCGLPFSKRYMQTLKTEPESNNDESQANKRKSTVPVKYKSTSTVHEEMVDSGTEDESQSYTDVNNGADEAPTVDVLMEVDKNELNVSAKDVKPMLMKQPVDDGNRIESVSPTLDHGYGVTGPLPPTPDSSDHCHEGKVSDDFQFNMVSPKEKKDAQHNTWPVVETHDQKTQDILPGGVVIEHPPTAKNEQGLVCELCSKIYCSEESLNAHYKNIHLGEMLACTVRGCTATFPSVQSRNRHSRNLQLHSDLVGLENDTRLSNINDLNNPGHAHRNPNQTVNPPSNPSLSESIPSY